MSEAVKLDFAKMDGLLPAIVQDAVSGEVLMVGFLNEQVTPKRWKQAL